MGGEWSHGDYGSPMGLNMAKLCLLGSGHQHVQQVLVIMTGRKFKE